MEMGYFSDEGNAWSMNGNVLWVIVRGSKIVRKRKEFDDTIL